MEELNKQLEQLANHFQHAPHSPKSAAAIEQGIRLAKRSRHKKHLTWQLSAVLVSFAILFLSLIKISPTFAAYIDQFPGMHAIVVLIEGDRGLTEAIEHHALQELDLSQQKGQTTVTINGMIADKQQIIFFYTIKNSARKIDDSLDSFSLKNTAGRSLAGSVDFGYTMSLKKSHIIHERISFTLNHRRLSNPIQLTLKIKQGRFSFHIPVNLKQIDASSVHYSVHKTVRLQGQKLTIQSVDLYPTRAAVHISFDPHNTKQITALNDLQLVDQTGMAVTQENGISEIEQSRNLHTYFLQSNYFNRPKSLELLLTRAQYIDKNSQHVLISINQRRLLKSPADHRLRLQSIKTIEANGSKLLQLRFAVRLPKSDRQHLYQMFDHSYQYESGTHEMPQSENIELSASGNAVYYLLFLPDKPYHAPIQLTLINYPSRLHGAIRLKIK
ncbi:MAG: DUF4179 domain-containing protein [Sporolactobacillus sp.]